MSDKALETPEVPLDQMIIRIQKSNDFSPPCVVVVNHTATYQRQFTLEKQAQLDVLGHPDRYMIVFNRHGKPVLGRC